MVGANLLGLGWRPIFFVNVPIGIVALILSHFLVRESKAPLAQKLDIGGALLSGVGLFCLILPIAEGRERGWPSWTFALFGFSILVGWAFVRHQKSLMQSGGAPLLDLKLFAIAGYRRGLVAILLLFSGISSFAFTLTYFLQKGLNVAPAEVGIIFSALSVSFLIASLSAVKIVARIGPKTLLVGLTIMQVGQLILIAVPLIWGKNLPPLAMMPILFLYGLGQGLSVPQIIRQTLADVQADNAGAASGVLSTAQQVAFSLGVSVVGGVFFAFIPKLAQPFDYSKGVAAAFACNFVFVLVARFLVASNIRHLEREGEMVEAHAAVVMEA